MTEYLECRICGHKFKKIAPKMLYGYEDKEIGAHMAEEHFSTVISNFLISH